MAERFTDDELDIMIKEADRRAYAGRLNRLRFLLSVEEDGEWPVSSLANEYYQEARLCWYVGAFVAVIVMSQLSLEEMLRAFYRVAKGVNGTLDSGRKLGKAGFADLVQQAEADGILSSEEAQAFHLIRREYRNPYVHPRDMDRDRDYQKPDWLRQTVKIVSPELLSGGVEIEARETIEILAMFLPRVSRRLWAR